MKKKSIGKYILEILTFFLILLTVYILVEVIVANVNDRPARIFGISVSYVPTKAMEPTISAGDYIIYNKVNYDDVKLDDIIIYYNSNEEKYIVHRVYKIYDNYIITKGDNNALADTFHVTSENLYGRYLGKAGVLKIFAGGINKVAVGIILFVLIFLFFGVQIFSLFIKYKNEKLKEDKEKKKELLREEMKKEILDEILNKKDDDK